MTPRTEVDWLDVGMDADAVKIALLDSGHTRLPVAEGSIDAVIGVVATRDIVATLLDGRAIDLRAMMRAAPVIPDQLDATDALGALRQRSEEHTAELQPLLRTSYH